MVQTKEEYIVLVNKVKEFAAAYYDNDAPLISDREYDNLMQEIKAIESAHPDWVLKDSITQIIGGSAKFSKVEHTVPMLSIQDVFDKESVSVWVQMMRSKYLDTSKPKILFSVEEKIDGLSCTLRYKYNKEAKCHELVLAETRGNGFIGEDVTENVRMIPDIPQNPVMSFTEDFQVRGEIYMTFDAFNKYNEKQSENGKEPAANARNLAAGTLRQKDASKVKERGLRMFIFNVQTGPECLMKDHCEALSLLSISGFPVVEHYLCDTPTMVLSYIDHINERRHSLDYPIDGAVVKINNIEYRNMENTTGKYQAGHIAYKYPQTEVKIELTDVDVQVGRTGKMTFTGVIRDAATKKPAQICGTSVSRVTLHNMDYIKDMKIGIGGVYGLIKSGEIIPMLTGCIEEPKQVFAIPEICPCCGTKLVKRGVDYWCDNKDCDAKMLNSLVYFVGRNQMNIEGLSESKLKVLLDWGYINKEFVSIYAFVNKLKTDPEFYNELTSLDGFGETSINNIIKAVDESRKTTFERVLVSQQIPNFGHGQVKLLSASLKEYVNKNREKLNEEMNLFDILYLAYKDGFCFETIEGFGEKLANNLVSWIENVLVPMYESGYNSFSKLLDELIIDTIEIAPSKSNTPLSGLTFVCTGSICDFDNREELYAYIESLGGKTSGSVSKKTSYLINNDVNSTSTKNKKAKELGIPIITEADLYKLIRGDKL